MKIPLFPLSLVLFPDSLFSLHIFEDRYKKLVKDCLKDEIPFGINFVHNAKMFDVGCLVKIDNVIQEYEDGKYDIVVKGIDRYYLQNFNDGEKSYFVGDVSIFNDNEEYVDPNLAIECIENFNEMIKRVKLLNINSISMAESNNKHLSFLIAQKAGFTGLQKQELLEITSENKRLMFIKNHLKNLLPSLEKAEQIERIIRNDGYLTNPR
jgi:ATP-dependent Lon protease